MARSIIALVVALLACFTVARCDTPDPTLTVTNRTKYPSIVTVSYKAPICHPDYFVNVATNATWSPTYFCDPVGSVTAAIYCDGKQILCHGTLSSKDHYDVVGDTSGCRVD